ncbi:MAG: radical SAM protein [Candidatus Bathyarchaeota archaeon]|nr:radical SAM protein [Candidatus Bathyarchaeota archaeon]
MTKIWLFQVKILEFLTQTLHRNSFGPAFYRLFVPWALRHPRYLTSAGHLLRAYTKANQLRKDYEQQGLKVPPALILSLTQQCNLSCSGCFAAASGITCNKNGSASKKKKPQLDWSGWRSIVSEASELGVFGFFLAGGEPFLFPQLIELCEEFNDRCFIVFTNGTAITENDFERLKRLSNTAIIVSIEGDEEATNKRRGDGVYQKALSNLRRLTEIGTPNGISATITRFNYKYWMNTERIDSLVAQGIRAALFLEYIPVMSAPGACSQGNDNGNLLEQNDHFLMLTPQERVEFREQILNYRQSKPLYIIHSPGDEELFGGCVSAGRGFAHVTPSGDLTPCPVSNVATHNLTTASLREGFASPLFTKIRENEELLENEGTPCSLFAHPKEVQELAKSVNAYRTDV